MVSHEEYINFDFIANDYDFSRAISEDLLKLFLASFLEVNDTEGTLRDVLEIGCGTGRISRIFAINHFNVTGVDISKNMLEIALIKAQKEKWKFRGIITDARNLPFKDNEFDIAYTVHVLHLIKDWKKVIQEALRCSKTKRFVNVNIHRPIHSTETMTKYWEFINESGFSSQYQTNKKIGAQNAEEVVEYMESIGFVCIKKEFTTKSSIKRQDLINITKSKSFSSQRFIPDEIHNLAIEYLAKHNYFLPTTYKNLELSENGTIYTYIMKK